MSAIWREWTVGVLLFAVLGPGVQPASAQYGVLHNFAGGTGDGATPHGTLTLSGSTIYGMTCCGGHADIESGGSVFKLNTDGAGYTNFFHNFTGSGYVDNPHGAVTLSGSKTLYGMTSSDFGGVRVMPSVGSTVFRIYNDGTGYTILHGFTSGGGSADPGLPQGSLTLSGTSLYGMTEIGGSNHKGAVFKINTDGSGYTILHTFAGTDGANPYGSLILSGATLYGMTSSGGSSLANAGVVFKVNTDGNGFAVLHQFAGYGNDDGAAPYGSLTLSGSTLYGMTSIGGSGATDVGTLFKINTDGNGYAILHNFAGGSGDGQNPHGDLALSGFKLYGMTSAGGSGGAGTVFQINTDGSGYTILHNFAGGTVDGASPLGSLTASGSTLYGMTSAGGSNNYGVVFALALSDAWDSGYQDLGNGWRRLTWFGDYISLGNNWIWHDKHDYMYVSPSSTPQSIYFYTMDKGWIWTSSTTYSYLYRFSDGVWLWYQPGSDNPRWFLNLNTWGWESW